MIGGIPELGAEERRIGEVADPLPLAKVQKSAEVLENKEGKFGEVQKSAGKRKKSEGQMVPEEGFEGGVGREVTTEVN